MKTTGGHNKVFSRTALLLALVLWSFIKIKFRKANSKAKTQEFKFSQLKQLSLCSVKTDIDVVALISTSENVLILECLRQHC